MSRRASRHPRDVRPRPRAKVVRASAALGVGLFALIGFAHTPAGRPLLNALRGAPGCPVDLDGADPTAVERARIASVRSRASATAAVEASRSALGFELGTTRKAEVARYFVERGIACEWQRRDSVLRCGTAPPGPSAQGAPPIDDLHLQFDPQQRLVAVDLYRAGTTAAAALSCVRRIDRQLERRIGPATSRRGEATADYLSVGNLRRVANEYRYRGVIAEVSATRFGRRGVRERYQWVPSKAQSPSGA